MGLYHERPKFAGNHPRRSVVVGRKEILESRPELGADWDAVNESFIVRVTRSFWEKAQKVGGPRTSGAPKPRGA